MLVLNINKCSDPFSPISAHVTILILLYLVEESLNKPYLNVNKVYSY